MKDDVAVVILAGGDGKRIGGGKPLRMLGGERLVDHAVSLAGKWSDSVAIAVRDRSQVGAVHADLISDEDVPGPLGGLISGMTFARDAGAKFLLAIPADMPFLPNDLLDRLRNTIGDHGSALAASGGHIHPVCSLWRADSIERARDYAASGRRSLNGLATFIGFSVADWPAEPLDPFFNINTSDELAEAARRNS